MFSGPVVCALVLALGACSGDVQAQAISRLFLPRDYGVKLCGREFIRAVIFTCGGSRWKRLVDADRESFQWSPHSVVARNSEQSTSHKRNRLPQHTASTFSSNSLAGGLTLHAAPIKSDQLESSGVLALLAKGGWPGNSGRRRRRHFSQGVAGVCCSEGCTKNDIGRLC
ncbi:relaxin-3-like isoform X1 [Vanacampus margaritifer]